MKILVDHSGYSLENLGDLAMLAATLTRVKGRYPGADVFVPTTAPTQMRKKLPEAIPVAIDQTRTGIRNVDRVYSRLINSTRPGYAIGRVKTKSGRKLFHPLDSHLRESDVVIAAGGGYLCDTFRVHAERVLGLLEEAANQGKATAFFGQGIGPAQNGRLRDRIENTLLTADAVSLRTPNTEGVVVPEFTLVTGDDALEFAAGQHRGAAIQGIIGLNFRVASYNGADEAQLVSVARQLAEFSESRGFGVSAVPIDTRGDLDLDSTRRIYASAGGGTVGLFPDSYSVEGLVRSVASCRFVVTMSYHAAVFALASGSPAICLTKSAYYDQKFSGLKELYGSDMVHVLPILEASTPPGLRDALERTAEVPVAIREAAIAQSVAMRDRGRALYNSFLDRIEHFGP